MLRVAAAIVAAALGCAADPGFRPPSVPLFARSPFFSVWSSADTLWDADTSWGPNGDTTEMVMAALVDGVPYRIMGSATGPQTWSYHPNMDAPGNDLPNMPVKPPQSTWQSCQQLCNQTAECGAWAFGARGCGGMCWLKSAAGPGIPDDCRDYGTKPSSRGFPENRTANQLDVSVLPTRTIYVLEAGGVQINLTFATPFVPGAAGEEAWARDASTLEASAQSADGKPHSVALYFDATADLITDSTSVEVFTGYDDAEDAALAGTAWMQPSEPESFDDMQRKDRVSFAQLLLAAAPGWGTGVAAGAASRRAFAAGAILPSGSSLPGQGTGTPGTNNPVLWAAANASVQPSGATVALGGGAIAVGMSFDPTFLFFGRRLRPHWTRLYPSARAMVEAAVTEHAATSALCAAFDANVTGQLQAAGGDDYRLVGSLAYRQAWASTAPVWDDEGSRRWVMLKEISSGSDSQTSDVIYPAYPLYAWADPAAAWQLLEPLMVYANNQTSIPYNLPWAPHHLGKYPVGDIEPSQQEQMPLEETAFMLISLADLSRRLGDGKSAWLPPQYNGLVDMWGRYLLDSAEIPGKQLCTDDFLGPIVNNSNLAAKAFVGMAAYAAILRSRGNTSGADAYDAAAARYVAFWQSHSLSDDGSHFWLSYDTPSTWSTKYNLMLQEAIAPFTGHSEPFPFPQAVIDKELAFYAASATNKYGIPLYSKATFGKADWYAFTGAIMDDDGFRGAMARIRAMLNDTTDRVPFTDWYDTITADRKGFRCRAVVGGMFARLFLGKHA